MVNLPLRAAVLLCLLLSLACAVCFFRFCLSSFAIVLQITAVVLPDRRSEEGGAVGRRFSRSLATVRHVRFRWTLAVVAR